MITPDKAGKAQAHLMHASNAAAIASAVATERHGISPGMTACAEHHARLLDFHFRRAADALGFDVTERVSDFDAHERCLRRMRELEGEPLEDIVGR